MQSERSWLAEKPGDVACKAQVQVLHGGIVSLVHPGSTDAKLKESSGNVFRVRWADGLFPNPTLGCPDECSSVSARGLLSSCLCDAIDTTVAVFTDTSPLPKPAQVLEMLRIGSPQPDSFPDGVYTPCRSKACNAALNGGVTVYTHADANGSVDDKAIFMVLQNGTRPTYLANLLSTVSIGAFSFRNPPKFHSFVRPTTRDAEHETEALLDHLFYHKNTAPFISRRLIQRLSTSNPSPRYVKAVATAFSSGAYKGTAYSGQYGDLGATFAAILLDPEARSLTLDVDPTHGSLREPLLKVYHVLRSLEWKSDFGQLVQLWNLKEAIGQQFYFSPTVFNFYHSEYQPPGAVADVGLAAPEAELATGPYMVGFFNVIMRGERPEPGLAGGWEGALHFQPQDPRNASTVIHELDLLLTGGRLTSSSRELIESAYHKASDKAVFEKCDIGVWDNHHGQDCDSYVRHGFCCGSGACPHHEWTLGQPFNYPEKHCCACSPSDQEALDQEALLQAQELFTFAPEFHTTSLHTPRLTARADPPPAQSHGREYTAIVYMWLGGKLPGEYSGLPPETAETESACRRPAKTERD